MRKLLGRHILWQVRSMYQQLNYKNEKKILYNQKNDMRVPPA